MYNTSLNFIALKLVMVTHFLIHAWGDSGRRIVNHRPVHATSTRPCFKSLRSFREKIVGEWINMVTIIKNRTKPKVLYTAEFTLLLSMANPGFKREKAETFHRFNVKTEDGGLTGK